MKLPDNIRYVGVNDHEIDLFEGQYIVPDGMAYNSYIIMDAQIAVMDSVDARFSDQWLDNIRAALDGRQPDYLIVQHMEPDHSGSIHRFMDAFPAAKIVASARAFTMMKNFFGTDFAGRQVVVGENDTLSLGSRTLTFVTAPMIHWPEVIMTYDAQDKTLFSADAFGKFGALDTGDDDWACEARRYYIGIVGKYGAPVQTLLKKAAGLDIQTICPLHGPVLTENLGYYIDLYNIWSSYAVEEDGVVIAYTSIYGHTKTAVELLAEKLRQGGCTVVVNDLARCDWAEAVEDAFRYGKLVLATTTYNGDIFPFMRSFIDHLTERGYSNRTVAFMENGSWAPAAARIMRGMLEKSKNLTYTAATVKILSALNEESTAQVLALAEELCSSTDEPAVAAAAPAGSRKFVCKICGYVHEADELPDGFTCPLCKRGAEDFEEVK